MQGGFHLLAIFDPLPTVKPSATCWRRWDYRVRAATVIVSPESVAAQVVERILAAGGLAIPAHVDADKVCCRLNPVHANA